MNLWQKNGIRGSKDNIEVKGQISSVIFEHQEQDLPHNPYDQEVRGLDGIRHGDVEMLNRSLAGNLSWRSKDSSPKIKSARRRILPSVLSHLHPVRAISGG
ncbi:MAG: hypothetical protein ACLVG6_02480 [Dorea formicigenerans]